jgi:hypothetical protein
MTTVRIITILLIFWLTDKSTVAQNNLIEDQDHPIYKLKSQLQIGDKSALFEIAPYFNGKQKVLVHYGMCSVIGSEAQYAKSIVSNVTLFMEDEFTINELSSAKEFTDFLNQNKNQIVFSELAKAFLITPLEKRKVSFEIRAISESRRSELRNNAYELLSPRWIQNSKIDSLIKQRNPLSLLMIASELFKIRNRPNYHEMEFINLLQLLTDIEIGFRNDSGITSWYIPKDFYKESMLNLLIYFSKYYSQYSWDDEKFIFAIPN